MHRYVYVSELPTTSSKGEGEMNENLKLKKGGNSK